MADIPELRKFVAPEFLFGLGARKLSARYAKNFGASQALVVTDPGIIAAGWAGELIEDLEAAGIPYRLFSDLTPNPKAAEVMAGAAVYEQERCDTIIVVGGGSAIDCAKGIGIVSSNGGHILDFEGVDRIARPGPPMICIPTTAGSSADVSQFAIITDTDRRVKIAIISKTVVPDVSLIDPLPLTTMPRELTVNTGMDALAHAFESYVSNAHSPVTDLFALEAVRLLKAHLAAAMDRPDDIDRRAGTMLGSLYAGLAFSNASLGLVHAMAHSLGGYLDIPHGECNALLLSAVVGFNFAAAPERYATIGEVLGLTMGGLGAAEQKALLVESLHEMKKSLGTDRRLSQLGVTPGHLADLAAKAINDPCLATNPRRPTRGDIEQLYAQAL
ncbi:MAG: iron-containing alcohol dehydrogenase [Desulfobacteraceae bacterium]|nr:iron-containing alcohol dehydrogenase [Desulfobacteraceae bacterium]